MNGDPKECLECGSCCFSRLDRYIRVRGDDHARLGEDAERLVVFIGNEAYMKMEEGHCAALSIEATLGRFVCTVYERRPETCRALARGSGECEGEIATKSDRPREMLAKLRAKR